MNPENPTIPTRFDKNRHTRQAFKLGRLRGRDAGRMLNPAELREWSESGTMARDLAESIDSEEWETVGHWQASQSRDIGSSSGLAQLNRILKIAETGTTMSRFCTNGDSCVMETYGNAVSSGVVTEREHLRDETIEAYDSGYAAGFAEKIDN